MEPADEVDGGGERPDHGGGDRGGGLASMYGETEIGNRHTEPLAP
jgi:hypothetical protein